MHALYVFSVWVHILAATVWIGGMLFLVLVVVPWLRSGGRANAAVFLRETGERFRKVGWTCFLLLIVTGTFNLWMRGVRLSDFARASKAALDALLKHAQKSRLSPTQLLEQLCEIEQRERDARNLARRLKRATIGAPSPLDKFDWNHPRTIDRDLYEELLTLDFLRRGENVLFRGQAGRRCSWTGYEVDGADGRPVARLSRPPSRRPLLCGSVDGAALCENRLVAASVAVGRRDVTDRAVEVLAVVPGHEAGDPHARGLDVRERLPRIARVVTACQPALTLPKLSDTVQWRPWSRSPVAIHRSCGGVPRSRAPRDAKWGPPAAGLSTAAPVMAAPHAR